MQDKGVGKKTNTKQPLTVKLWQWPFAVNCFILNTRKYNSQLYLYKKTIRVRDKRHMRWTLHESSLRVSEECKMA